MVHDLSWAKKFLSSWDSLRRSQWERGLRAEMSSPAQTLGSWVRIPLEAWLSARVSSVFVLSCVGSGLATGLITVQEFLPTVYKIHSWRLIDGKQARGPNTKGRRRRRRSDSLILRNAKIHHRLHKSSKQASSIKFTFLAYFPFRFQCGPCRIKENRRLVLPRTCYILFF
jgi:hypothetical protein